MLEIGLSNGNTIKAKEITEKKLIEGLQTDAQFLQLSKTTFVRASDIVWFKETSDSPSNEWDDMDD